MSSVPLGEGSKLSNHPFVNTFVINSIPRCERPTSILLALRSVSSCSFPSRWSMSHFIRKKNSNNKAKTNSSGEQAVLGQGTAVRCKASSLDRNSLRQGMFQFASQGNNPILDTQSQWKKNLLRLVKPKELRDVKQAVTCFIPTCITCIIVKPSERWEEFL